MESTESTSLVKDGGDDSDSDRVNGMKRLKRSSKAMADESGISPPQKRMKTEDDTKDAETESEDNGDMNQSAVSMENEE